MRSSASFLSFSVRGWSRPWSTPKRCKSLGKTPNHLACGKAKDIFSKWGAYKIQENIMYLKSNNNRNTTKSIQSWEPNQSTNLRTIPIHAHDIYSCKADTSSIVLSILKNIKYWRIIRENFMIYCINLPCGSQSVMMYTGMHSVPESSCKKRRVLTSAYPFPCINLNNKISNKNCER